ncbi:MAG: SBBP repeat-containing protein, partial [Candidatus Aminicenantes bacterium]|nr:SBBP repeat-containing protein [Candidatus Aminicenantes bacterium]
MKPAFIILFAVLLLVPSHSVLSREEAASSGEAISSQALQLHDQRLPGEQQNAKKADARTIALLNDLPLYFVENKGQVNDQVRYYTKVRNGTVYFTGEEIVYQFLLGDEERARPHRTPVPAEIESSTGWASAGGSSPIREEAIRVRFVGANKETRLEAAGEREAKFSYFRGNDPQKWASGARSYQKVAYRELYPGIDLVVSGREGRMKNEYVVRPGGEPAAIRVKYEGAKGLEVNEKGQLVIRTSEGMLIEDVPLSYQIIKGKKKEVETRYQLSADDSVQFRVGGHRKDTELIIDPLTYSTFLGGTSGDISYGIAVDGSGNVYVAGYTYSPDFPTTSGAYDTSYNGLNDVFLAKVDSSGSALLYAMFLGGTSDEAAFTMAVDGS